MSTTKELPKKSRDLINSSLWLTIKVSLVSFVTTFSGFLMSFPAEHAVQETGLPRTMLGYNRDFLVDGQWYFLAASILSLVFALRSWIKLSK